MLYDRHSVLTQKLGDPAESQDIGHGVFVKLPTKSALYAPAFGKPAENEGGVLSPTMDRLVVSLSP